MTEGHSKLKVDWDGLKAHQERKTNGYRLFGKYYEGLWDYYDTILLSPRGQPAPGERQKDH